MRSEPASAAWDRTKAAVCWPPLLGLTVAIVIVAISLVAGQSAATLLAGTGWAPTANRTAVLFLLGMQAAMIILTLLAAEIEGRNLRLRLALGVDGVTFRTLALASGGGLALTAIYTAVMVAAGLSNLAADLKPFLALLRSPEWALAILAVVIGAPLSEELLFRAYLFPSLSRSLLRVRGAAVVSTAAWTTLHAGYSAAGMVEVFLFGLYFSWLLTRTGSLVVPVVCHALINAVTLVFVILVF